MLRCESDARAIRRINDKVSAETFSCQLPGPFDNAIGLQNATTRYSTSMGK